MTSKLQSLFSATLFSGALISSTLFSASANAVSPTETENEVLAPGKDQIQTARNVIYQLSRGHYERLSLDDDLSAKMYDRYIQVLDNNHNYFLQSDVDGFNKYRLQLDDDLKLSNLEPGYIIYNTYLERVMQRLNYNIEYLQKDLSKIDFTKNESVFLDRSEAPRAASMKELKDLWRKRIKSSVLDLNMADKDYAAIKELLLKRFKNQLNRLSQTNNEDVFQTYINALTHSYDPHTAYFSPRSSENFNINMRLSLEGIGAVLQMDNEFTKVVRLVPAGPADKAGELKPADRIVGVGQGVDGPIEDVIGWRLDEVVDRIRGSKGSTVRLEILPANDDQHRTVISIVRDKVKLEDQSAKKEIIEFNRNGTIQKIGVINLPAFYIDFEARQKDPDNYKSTTRDVQKLVEELKAEKVDGIVIDLRNNGGGALQEANALTGLFIPSGPTVQVRSNNGRVDILGDPDDAIVYDGPLAVLVNRLSASASEIFAGAIQDMDRGLIIGGQTFGKGTVQSLKPMNRGQIKLTQAKFYRISGDSTQHQGVVPDIAFPSLYDKTKIGESALEEALPWDKIQPVPHVVYHDIEASLEQLEKRHKDRIKTDPDFIHLVKQIELIEEIRERKSLSLNKKTRINEKEKNKAQRLTLENERRKAKGMELLKDIDDLTKESDEITDKTDDDSSKDNDAKKDVKSDDKEKEADKEDDAMLKEASNILLDFIDVNSYKLTK